MTAAPSFLRRHATGLLAWGLGLGTLLLLVVVSPHTGYTRDEGFYFEAAESHAGWFRALAERPATAFSEPVIRRHYEVNHEHPVLVKSLMALSFLALAADEPRDPSAWPPARTGAFARAMRLPSQAFSGLAVALTFLLGAAVSGRRRVGVFAALMFLLAPRHLYHAQLACFDMPAVAVWLAVVLCYRRARASVGWSLATGLAWGLAIATKHNSFFLPFVLGLHWLFTEGRELGLNRSGFHLPRIPLAFFAMLILGPLVFVGHWPYLWHDTLARVGWYFGFHLNHVNYHWEYFGTLLTDPPFPWAYPFAVTALTFPLAGLALGCWGFLAVLGERLGHPVRALGVGLGRFAGLGPWGEAAPRPAWLSPSDGWLLLFNAFIPLLVIAIPSVPIFGGVKHWMHAMPFVCVLGALALERALALVPERLGRFRLQGGWLHAALAGLVLLPALLGAVRIQSYGTSFYNELAGGVSGAADLGMQRQYWSNNVTGVLPWLNEHAPPNARVYLHEVTGQSFHAYRRDGLLRPDLRPAWDPDHADFSVYQYHREFVDTEFRVWNRLGHRAPVHGLYLDEVPIILVYDTRRAPPPLGVPALPPATPP
jgi:4-amino-4-deoxy-L-arabinose transferase-like glycosyltransferase